MSYPGGMSQLAYDQQERENESGADLCECWHEEQRRLLNEFSKIKLTAQPEAAKRVVSPIDTYTHPF